MIERYHAKIHPQRVRGMPVVGRRPRVQGHGRFWVGADPAPGPPREFVVIAHRFGYAPV